MPRLASISHPALRAIAEDQRYAPKAAALRAVERIESLAQEIDSGASYPRDYIVFRVTGYRPSEPAIELVAGQALLEDLSALAETLSANARLADASLPSGTLTVEELRERWGVSRRSIDRDRRRGLIARRVRDELGSERLAFVGAVVESFERAHEERDPDRERKPLRLTESERSLILSRAERYEETLDMSRPAIVGRLASRLGRSVGAVRRVLDEGDEDAREMLTDRVRSVLLRKWERGVPIEDLAACAQRSRATVHRVVLRERLKRLESVGDPGPSARADAESGALEAPIAQAGLRIPVPQGVEGVMALAEAVSHAPEAEERAFALASRAAWRRCFTLVRTLPQDAPPAQLVDRAETDARWAGVLRVRLVWFALPMIVRTIEDRAEQALPELPSGTAMRLVEGCMALAAVSAAGYDASRAGRLAGRASLGVDRFIEKELGQERRLTASGTARQRRTIEVGGWRAKTLLGGELDPVLGWLLKGLDRLSPEARSRIEARYGLAGDRPRTVAELAEIEGVGVRAMWVSLRRSIRVARGERA